MTILSPESVRFELGDPDLALVMDVKIPESVRFELGDPDLA